MFKILCFDICALAILAILFFALEFRNTATDRGGKKLAQLVVVTMFAAVLDMAANYYNGHPGMRHFNYICSGLYNISRNASFFLYASYIMTIAGIWRKGNDRIFNIIKFLPFLGMVFIAVSSPFTGWFYYYDNSNSYVRGEAFFWIYVASTFYALYAVYYVLKSTPIIGKRKVLSLTSCATFSLMASIIQYFNSSFIIDILCFSLSLLFIVMFIDNPGDKIDQASLLLGGHVYTSELRMSSYVNKPVDILHINITNYKTIEEMLSYGNLLLFSKKIGSMIKDICAQERTDGSAFYLKNGRIRIILNRNNLERTKRLAELIKDAFNAEISVNDTSFQLESSLCITQCPQDFNILDDMVTFGSIAWQFEKPGKIVYSSDILKSDNYEVRANIGKLIEQGLLNDRFEVAYDPIYSVESGEFKEVEATLRLRDSNQNYIDQDVFIPAAEENGSIVEIGYYVLTEVCKYISGDEFKKTGIEKINIKLSVVQCLQKDFAEQILAILNQYSVSPDKIRFEITESVVSDNQKTFENNIRQLSNEGFSFALDDYGTGYSNITTLSTMPLEVIRFDKSFANSIGNEKVNAIFEHSVEMVKALGKIVVIEGVESKELADRLEELKCDYLQGSFFAYPMPEKRLVEFYENNSREQGL